MRVYGTVAHMIPSKTYETWNELYKGWLRPSIYFGRNLLINLEELTLWILNIESKRKVYRKFISKQI